MTLTHQTGPAAVKETLRAPAAPQVLVLSDLSYLKPLDMYGVEQVVTLQTTTTERCQAKGLL